VIFSLSSLKGGEGRGEEAVISKTKRLVGRNGETKFPEGIVRKI
jgi:hypothetical protein